MKRLVAAALTLSAATLASAQVAPNSQAPAAARAADERVVVTRPMVPVPDVGDGAPYFSVEDLKAQGDAAQAERLNASVAARTCQVAALPKYFANAPTFEILFRDEQAAATSLDNAAAKAAKATEAALNARADAAAGLVDMKAVEQTELDRQAAVTQLAKAQDKWVRAYNRTADAQELFLSGRARDMTWTELDMREAQRRRFTAEDMRQEFAGLKLTESRAEELRDKKKGERFLRVSGKITNNRTTSVPVPGIFITAVDERGFPLVTRKANTGRGEQLKAGVAQPFVYDLKPLPSGTVTALVHLASRATPPPHLSADMFCDDGPGPPD
ncbi:MAG TPA: hypothetical protein VGO52_00905 [Hyphomonadaceae bacterium]|jgi:hypothetical protein|nr:hypothetical protein [Hyphomonadaceae bacterium]